jgi:phenylalanine ammonia-lyase
VLEREINSANDNPLVDPETGALYKAGNFYGGHVARLLDGWKLDMATMANWGNSLVALLVDDRFNGGLPNGLVNDPGVNTGMKGMQLSVTALCCAVRQMAGPSLIQSLSTESYNQDVVSLGMHAAATAMDALECLRDETAMALMAAAQAVEMRGAADRLGAGSRRVFERVREGAAFLDRDRRLDSEIGRVSALIAQGW